MKTYEVTVTRNTYYQVEAASEEEAVDLVLEGDDDVVETGQETIDHDVGVKPKEDDLDLVE